MVNISERKLKIRHGELFFGIQKYLISSLCLWQILPQKRKTKSFYCYVTKIKHVSKLGISEKPSAE